MVLSRVQFSSGSPLTLPILGTFIKVSKIMFLKFSKFLFINLYLHHTSVFRIVNPSGNLYGGDTSGGTNKMMELLKNIKVG